MIFLLLVQYAFPIMSYAVDINNEKDNKVITYTEEKIIDDIIYEIIEEDGNKYASISKYTGNSSNLVIPETIDDIVITKISNSAFKECTSLKEVKLPNTINEIGQLAFSNCTNLEKINYPSNLKSFSTFGYGYGVFENCPKLTTIEIPEGVEKIVDGIFMKNEHII